MFVFRRQLTTFLYMTYGVLSIVAVIEWTAI
ncbi:hypothetical protein GGD88_000684 [Roseospira goensis]|uniref:Uncharacterized protein n=1 Tax=Roseospira goensis TaxID=391922 RepID=A0A7W6WJF7_9PROT|nr:hypothetical protein [Roseospira goensis]